MSDMVSSIRQNPVAPAEGGVIEIPPHYGEVAVAQQLTEGALSLA